MADIKLTKDCYVPKENINFYVAYESNAVKSDVRKKRRDQLVFDYTNGKKNTVRSIFENRAPDHYKYFSSNNQPKDHCC